MANPDKIDIDQLASVLEAVRLYMAADRAFSVETVHALAAVVTIATKSHLTLMDLRQGLSDGLAGAFVFAAEAMAVKPSELLCMIERKEITTLEFLPRFERVLRAKADAIMSEGNNKPKEK